MIADVVAVGARGPLGLSSTQVAMCVRAHKLEPQSVSFHDRRGQEIGVALTGGLGERLFGYPRMVALAAPALAEAVYGLPEALVPTPEQPLPLVLCVPERGRPDDSERFDGRLIEELAERSGVLLDSQRSAVIREGHAGFAHGVAHAKRLLDELAPVVCVGGVDSYYHPEVLRWLDAGYRLHAIGADSGFIPGEAAAFVMLARAAGSGPRLGRILDVETAQEPTTDGEESANLAEAMTAMLENMQQRLGRKFSWTISDFNGERNRLREWQRARARTIRPEAIDTKWVWDTGDVGAASGALFSAIALKLFELDCAPSSSALLALHSEGSERGLVALEGGNGQGETP